MENVLCKTRVELFSEKVQLKQILWKIDYGIDQHARVQTISKTGGRTKTPRYFHCRDFFLIKITLKETKTHFEFQGLIFHGWLNS